jgi:hypothetical protein
MFILVIPKVESQKRRQLPETNESELRKRHSVETFVRLIEPKGRWDLSRTRCSIIGRKFDNPVVSTDQ